MKCPSCNLELGENAKFCPICGATVIKSAPVEITPEPAEIPVEQPVFKAPAQPAVEQPVFKAPAKPSVEQPVFQAPVQPTYQAPAAPAKPEQKLMGPWGYIGWNILFSIPLVGFILLIVFSFDNSNLNLRNYARSYWCALLLVLILVILIVVLLVVAGVSLSEITSNLPQY